jgi:hypothetical protein
MPPVRAGLDALHFEINGYNQNRGYLKASDLSEIKGASLADGRGSVLKPIGMSQPVTGTSSQYWPFSSC